MLLVGYFEGIDSERGIAWRSTDSLALREFLGVALEQSPPNHSSVSRTRRRLDLETHQQVLQWILGVLAKEDLVEGKTLGIDATTLEANAALRSIVRRDSGESYNEYLNGLAKASGIETPRHKDRAKVDKKRPKKGSNDDWQHPQDPDARITKMKDGRTHLAHKLEHAVDMSTGAVIAVTVQAATEGDSQTVTKTVARAREALTNLRESDQQLTAKLQELVMDRGYHSNATMTFLKQEGIRSYVAEPDRGRRRWKHQREAQLATYANRRRIGGHRGKRLLRRRGEILERTFAHCLETGALRRIHLRHRHNALKRALIHVGAFNLSLIMRNTLGAGTPRGLPQRLARLLLSLQRLSNRAMQHAAAVSRSRLLFPGAGGALRAASAPGC